MLAKEADQIKSGDPVLAFNGPYCQHATVRSVTKDHRGVRWIGYNWTSPRGKPLYAQKRHNSVYLPN